MNEYRIVAYFKSHSFPVPQTVVYFYAVDAWKDGFYICHGPFNRNSPEMFELTHISRTKSTVLDYLRCPMAYAGSWIRVPDTQRGRGQFIAREFGLSTASDICINTGLVYHVEEGGLYTLDPLSKTLLGI